MRQLCSFLHYSSLPGKLRRREFPQKWCSVGSLPAVTDGSLLKGHIMNISWRSDMKLRDLPSAVKIMCLIFSDTHARIVWN